MKKFLLLILYFTMSLAYSQDWANLKRFKEANNEVIIMNNAQSLVVFMGNSITEGWLNDELSFFNNSSYINRGIGGQTTSQMLLRFRQDVIALKPKAVVILAGINDIAQNNGAIEIKDIYGNITSMIELARMNDIEVVLCSVLPAKEFPWRKEIDPIEKILQLNSFLSNYAKKENIIYVDYYTALVTTEFGLPDNLTSDEVHLTLDGYRALEPILMKGINKALD